MLSWPFDSVVSLDTEGNPVYSRTYSADVLANILKKYFRNGVFNASGTGFQVTAATGMTVTVKAGEGLINGRHCYEESDRVLAVQAAHASLDRIDTVVLRLNLALEALMIDLFVVQGTAAATPSAPALTRNASVYELALADLFIVKNTTSITQQRITDARLDSSRCGVVASIIGDTDTSAYYAQIAADLAGFKSEEQAAFVAWFAGVQGALGEDVAGNLLNLVNKYKSKQTTVTIATGDWTLSNGVYVATKSVSIVPANCTLHASPVWASKTVYQDAEAGVSAASAGSVTFTAVSIPTASVTVNIAVSEVDA